jgi:L-threonylcarbamoyladenylate synthase
MVDSDDPDPQIISIAIEAVKMGKIIIYPTDTVYGLGTNALNPFYVRRIFKVKDRPLTQALPIAVANLEMAKKLAYISKEGEKLIRKFWPGPLTIILKKKRIIPSIVTSGYAKVGLRAPNHMIPLSIISGSNLPLITTSANKHGGYTPITAEEAIKQIGNEVDLVLDGGKTKVQVPSTVVDLTKKPPVILREGSVSRKAIEEVINTLEK